MSFNAYRENKILAKISGFTVTKSFAHLTLHPASDLADGIKRTANCKVCLNSNHWLDVPIT